ncbi:hypothetical protein TeGR_g5565 [Tetraparma gracilis]|uniref:Protein kinase domain-containing protein n=1 Tax=Tetraparma gracilis TaxID=2962635 RepID=A0ABQ6N6T1_9STRA|nr:hypothetical protein TeGR_g5565 [Tetraparma gracilis]
MVKRSLACRDGDDLFGINFVYWRYCDPELDNSVVCMACSPGSYSFSSSQEPCAPCPAGTFNPSPSSTSIDDCQLCPAGTSNPVKGSSTSSDCQVCSRGFFAVAGAESCSACPAGTYLGKRGGTSVADCAACPNDLTSAPGSVSASNCFDDTLTFGMYLVEHGSTRFSFYSKHTGEFKAAFEGAPLSDPSDSIFISSTRMLITSTDSVLEFRYDGSFVGVFAEVALPTALALLSELDQVAVSSFKVTFGTQAEKSVLFFNVPEGMNDGQLTEEDAVSKVVMPIPSGHAFIATDIVRVGGSSNQLLVAFWHTNGFSTRRVWKICIPNTGCEVAPQELIGSLRIEDSDIAGAGFVGKDATDMPMRVATISSVTGFLITLIDEIRICPREYNSGLAGYLYNGIAPYCPLFAVLPNGKAWLPGALHVDEHQELLFVYDGYNMEIHAFDFAGVLISTISAPAYVKSMTFKPGSYAPLAQLSLPSAPSTVEPLTMEISLRDRSDEALPPSYDITYEVPKLAMSARGSISVSDELEDLIIPLDGTVVVNGAGSIEASIGINFAGDWDIDLVETFVLSSEYAAATPLTVTVSPGPTVSSECRVDAPSSVVAGETFTVTVSTFDIYGNPTMHEDDEFVASIDGIETPLSPSGAAYAFSTALTKAGIVIFGITDASGELVGGTKLGLEIEHASPSAIASTCDAGNITSIVSAADTPLPLQATVRDPYGNAVSDAGGVVVQVEESDTLSEYPLEPPGYLHTLTILEGLGATLTIAFLLDNEQIGETLMISVAPPPKEKLNMRNVIIGAACGAAVLVGLLVYLYRHRKATAQQVKTMQSLHLKKEKSHHERQKVLEVEKEQQMARASKLRKENENLHDSLRKKKHSDKELAAMKNAMEEQKEERKDELRTVLVSSKDIEIKELLGQGGMGKVHLANYKGQRVAVKQLITINDESVMRFRRECFLTKEMSHPNIVILIGVCWDDMMLGCMLEYVDGGSLQDRLKKDWNEDFEDKITWKGELLKWAREAALGCQYLHHKRYFDETADEWKDGIVHRDLKPDNMLVTTAGVLKLTDFGEARTAEVDMTMTAVGTPIFVCPEIIRSGRYDVKADSYSFGICLVAMMRIEDTIVNFFFNALIKKMRKKSRQGVGLMALNRNVETGWRPTLPDEFYPSFIDLIWRCWDDDPDNRPDMDEIVRLLMGPIADEVRSNVEPIFGSGRVIGACTQKDMALADDESAMVSKEEHEKALSEKDRERDLAVAKKDKMLQELRDTMKEKDSEIAKLKTTKRKEGGGGTGTQKLERTASSKKVDDEMKNMLAMMGR